MPRKEGPLRDRLRRILAHLFQHQIHHRGQAPAMLSSTPVAPPQLDEFISVAEEPLRANEFSQLGWTEDRGGNSNAAHQTLTRGVSDRPVARRQDRQCG